MGSEKVGRKDPRVDATERKIRSTILEVFRENSPEYRDHQYHVIEGHRSVITLGFGDDPRYHEAEYQQNFEEGIPRTITMLEALISTVDERTDQARPILGKLVEERPRGRVIRSSLSTDERTVLAKRWLGSLGNSATRR